MRYRPWALDFTPDDTGFPPFPVMDVVNPYQLDANGNDAFLEWSTDDWDIALRFWTLEYDPHLVEWLKSVNPIRPSIMASREFAMQEKIWRTGRKELLAKGWLETDDLAWQPDPDIKAKGGAAWAKAKTDAFYRIRADIEALCVLMEDDRERYLPEIDAQADGVPDSFISFLGASQARHPWTIELINCALGISNIAYMYYKQYFKRVRPSTLCPGLLPAFGPPAHPSFPSGHSCAGHLVALFLLEVPGLRQRHGVFAAPNGSPGAAPDRNTLRGIGPVNSPLIWLGERLAKNRERLGVHYPSDSMGSRHLAAGLWWALLHEPDEKKRINCPSLRTIINHAAAEWPTKWQ